MIHTVIIGTYIINQGWEESVEYMQLGDPEYCGYAVINVTGLDPVKADIATTPVTGSNGAIYNRSRVLSRNIVLDIVYMDNPSRPVQDLRRRTYRLFPLRQDVKVYIDTDGRQAVTHGYIESNQISIFNKRQGAQISIICPDSYMYRNEDQVTQFSSISPGFEFPFSNTSIYEPTIQFGEVVSGTNPIIQYDGDVSIGLDLQIEIHGCVGDITVTNIVTGESIIIDNVEVERLLGIGMRNGDSIRISTVSGNKFATLTRSQTVHNILNALGWDVDWLTLSRGQNIFTYDTPVGKQYLEFTISNRIAYEGI